MYISAVPKKIHDVVIKQKVNEFAKQYASGHFKALKRPSKYRRQAKIIEVSNTITKEWQKKS